MKQLNITILFIAIVLVGAVSVMVGTTKKRSEADLVLTSTSFNNNAQIPSVYTCDGKNISPQLSWTLNSPQAVKSYVLIVDDPDAQKVVGKTFVHWVAILSGDTRTLPEAASGNLHAFDKNAIELPNTYAENRYKGSCPPVGGGKHVYRFTLFATTLPVQKLNADFLQALCTAEMCRKRLAGSIVAEALLVGSYTRKK